MEPPTLRDVSEADLLRVLELNADEVQHTSPMDLDRLRLLHSMASYHRVACVDGEVAAFLLALKDHAPYVNDNYAWFSARYPEFLYVDRIVVDHRFQGRALGSLLYRDLFRFAQAQQVKTITCEFNLVPPNEPSRRFHAKFGFEEVGTQWLAGGTKRVSLQAAATSSPGPR